MRRTREHDSERVTRKLPLPDARAALDNGFNQAQSHAQQMDCAMFFAAGDDDPVNATEGILENTLYRLLPLPNNTVAQTADRYDVQINTAGAFFNAAANANGTVTVTMPNAAGTMTLFTFANLATFQGFLLLHELGHQAGVFGIDVNAAANGANSQAVLNHCFTKYAQGVYH